MGIEPCNFDYRARPVAPFVHDGLEVDIALTLDDVAGFEPIVDVAEDFQDLATKWGLLLGDGAYAVHRDDDVVSGSRLDDAKAHDLGTGTPETAHQ